MVITNKGLDIVDRRPFKSESGNHRKEIANKELNDYEAAYVDLFNELLDWGGTWIAIDTRHFHVFASIVYAQHP